MSRDSIVDSTVIGCLRLSNISVICHVIYLQFPIQACFSSTSSARRHGGVYGLPNIGRRRKYREVSCTERTFQGNDFEWIPTVKMETRHLVEGYFGSKISGDL